MRFNIRQVEAFRAVIVLGSMTKASELLGISQPAVSRLIVDFQEAVGFKLFNRHRGGVEPTDDAKTLFDQVEKLFVGLEEIGHHVNAIKNLSSGSVTISALGLYANGLLPGLISRYHQVHPDVSVRLDSQPHDRVAEWVGSHRSDVGFATLPVTNTSFPTLELMKRPAVCIFPTGHEFEARNEIRASEMADHPFVSFPTGTAFRYEVDALFDRKRIDRVMMVEATTHEAVCNLVAAKLGVSIVSPYSPHLRQNQDLSYRPFLPEMQISFGILGDPSSMSIAARSFYDFSVDFFSRPDHRQLPRAKSKVAV